MILVRMSSGFCALSLQKLTEATVSVPSQLTMVPYLFLKHEVFTTFGFN